MTLPDPSSNKTSGYHLFFEPSDELARELQEQIAHLATAVGGPVFIPHVTLLGQISETDEEIVLAKAEKVASVIAPVSITLGEVGMEDAYFRALYIKVSEQEEMHARHEVARDVFDMQDEYPYLAHLSLLYGNYSPDVKQQLLESLVAPQGSFYVDQLYLYKTEGEVGNWKKIATFELGGK